MNDNEQKSTQTTAYDISPTQNTIKTNIGSNKKISVGINPSEIDPINGQRIIIKEFHNHDGR